MFKPAEETRKTTTDHPMTTCLPLTPVHAGTRRIAFVGQEGFEYASGYERTRASSSSVRRAGYTPSHFLLMAQADRIDIAAGARWSHDAGFDVHRDLMRPLAEKLVSFLPF